MVNHGIVGMRRTLHGNVISRETHMTQDELEQTLDSLHKSLVDAPQIDYLHGAIEPMLSESVTQPPQGEDGVVKYTSAHVDYAESEFIVRSGHSCQMNPLTIEEVRRILLENLGQNVPPKNAGSP